MTDVFDDNSVVPMQTLELSHCIQVAKPLYVLEARVCCHAFHGDNAEKYDHSKSNFGTVIFNYNGDDDLVDWFIYPIFGIHIIYSGAISYITTRHKKFVGTSGILPRGEYFEAYKDSIYAVYDKELDLVFFEDGTTKKTIDYINDAEYKFSELGYNTLQSAADTIRKFVGLNI